MFTELNFLISGLAQCKESVPIGLFIIGMPLQLCLYTLANDEQSVFCPPLKKTKKTTYTLEHCYNTQECVWWL